MSVLASRNQKLDDLVLVHTIITGETGNRRSGWTPASVADVPRRERCAGVLSELHRQQVESTAHVSVCEESLRVLLGPQWDCVLAIARTLENDHGPDCEASLPGELGASRRTSMRWITATEIVLRAAIEHGRALQIDAARRIARHVGATGVDGLAAIDAVRALTMQDLVGQHGFTVSYFEYLLHPWNYLHPNWSPAAADSDGR